MPILVNFHVQLRKCFTRDLSNDCDIMYEMDHVFKRNSYTCQIQAFKLPAVPEATHFTKITYFGQLEFFSMMQWTPYCCIHSLLLHWLFFCSSFFISISSKYRCYQCMKNPALQSAVHCLKKILFCLERNLMGKSYPELQVYTGAFVCVCVRGAAQPLSTLKAVRK